MPVGSIVAALLWIDRWEPEPARLLWLAFGWGASVAAITALLINNTAEAVGDALLGHGHGDTISAVVSRAAVRGGRQGRVRARHRAVRCATSSTASSTAWSTRASSPPGFAFTENIYYFGRAFAEHGFGDTSTSGVVTAFILRGVLVAVRPPAVHRHDRHRCRHRGPHAQPHRSRSSPRSAATSPPSCCTRMWNAAATLGTAQTFLNVYFLVMVPIFIAGVMFVSWHRRREQKIVARALPGDGRARLGRPGGRRAAHQPHRAPRLAGAGRAPRRQAAARDRRRLPDRGHRARLPLARRPARPGRLRRRRAGGRAGHRAARHEASGRAGRGEPGTAPGWLRSISTTQGRRDEPTGAAGRRRGLRRPGRRGARRRSRPGRPHGRGRLRGVPGVRAARGGTAARRPAAAAGRGRRPGRPGPARAARRRAARHGPWPRRRRCAAGRPDRRAHLRRARRRRARARPPSTARCRSRCTR